MKKVKQPIPENTNTGAEPIHKPITTKKALTVYAVVTNYTEGTSYEKFFKTREKAKEYLEAEYGKYKQEVKKKDKLYTVYSSNWDTEHYVIECEVEG